LVDYRQTNSKHVRDLLKILSDINCHIYLMLKIKIATIFQENKLIYMYFNIKKYDALISDIVL